MKKGCPSSPHISPELDSLLHEQVPCLKNKRAHVAMSPLLNTFPALGLALNQHPVVSGSGTDGEPPAGAAEQVTLQLAGVGAPINRNVPSSAEVS